VGLDRAVCFVFFFYCVTVGSVLLVTPWTTGWNVLLSHLPPPLPGVVGHPLVRGCLSGFGLVHFVWGLHDLTTLVRADLALGAPRAPVGRRPVEADLGDSPHVEPERVDTRA
jgi:hypothetical protein